MRALQAVLALSAMLVILLVAVALSPAVGARDPTSCRPCGDDDGPGGGPQNKGIACTADPPTGSVTGATIGPASATFQWQVKWLCPGWPPDQDLCRACNYVEIVYWDGLRWEDVPGGREDIVSSSAVSCGFPYTLHGQSTITYPVPAGVLKPGTMMLFRVHALAWDPATGPGCDPNLFYPVVAKQPWTFP